MFQAADSYTYDMQDLMTLDQHIAEIDRLGYTIFHGVADQPLLEQLRRRVDEIVLEEGDNAAREHHKEEGCHRLADLVNKDALFDQVWLQPDILAVIRAHFNRPFKLSSLNAREALLGGGHQPLHQDQSCIAASSTLKTALHG